MGRPFSKPTREQDGPRSFTCFSRLPTELRLMIWEASLEPRNLRIIPEARVRNVKPIRGEDWGNDKPAQLATCHEAREVALRCRPWEYAHINILYLVIVDTYNVKRFCDFYANRARILVLGGSGLPLTRSRCRRQYWRRILGGDMPEFDRAARCVWRSWEAIATWGRVFEKVLFVVAAFECAGPAWLFTNSDLAVIPFDDPRLEKVLRGYRNTRHILRKGVCALGEAHLSTLTSEEVALGRSVHHMMAGLGQGLKMGAVPRWIFYRHQNLFSVGVPKAVAVELRKWGGLSPQDRQTLGDTPNMGLAMAFHKAH